MTCPICGKQFPAEEYQILDNGNPLARSAGRTSRKEKNETPVRLSHF